MSLLRRSPKSNRKNFRTLKTLIEALERRTLLTTITAGHFFEYQDALGNIVRVKVTGNNPNTAVTLTGATEIQAPLNSPDDLIDGVADAQFPIINDIPGAFDGSRFTNVVLGGIGGELGSLPIAYATTGGD